MIAYAGSSTTMFEAGDRPRFLGLMGGMRPTRSCSGKFPPEKGFQY